MNKELFLQATVSNISQVYKGKRACCRCGCGGDYTATSYMDTPRTYTDINDKLVARRLKQAHKLVIEGASVDYGTTYVDVETGYDRTLTFYFDEVKVA
jgi:hypothetical protein